MLQSHLLASSLATHPESEILLCCARTHLESETTSRLRALLEQNIDWVKLIEMAQQHRVTPLLYSNLNAIGTEAVPKAILNQLQVNFRANTRRSLLLSAELVRLLNLFQAQKIPALPFKGPVLAASAYGNLSLRQFNDLDILVHPQDIEKAKALFLAEGYQMKIERIEVTEEQKATFVRSQSIHQFVREAAYPFINDQNGVVAELHWGVMPQYFSFPIDGEALWENLEWVSISGNKIPNLSPENTLLMLVGHGTKDCWRELARICDIAELIRSHPQLNWTLLIEEARIKGGARMLFVGLMLAHNLLGTLLPEEVVQKIQAEKDVELLTQQVSEQLFSLSNASLKDGSVTRFHLRIRERLMDKMQYFLKVLITPTTTDWLMLPWAEFPAFLYYLLRPIRLIKHQVSKVFN